MDPVEFVLIRDGLPVEEGGFRPGVKFTRGEMVRLLADKSLSEGSAVFRQKTGQVYVVSYEGRG